LKADVLGVVEAAYAQAPDDAAWLAGIADAAAPLVDQGLGMVVERFVVDPQQGPTYTAGIGRGTHGEALLTSNKNMVAEVRARGLPGFLSQVSLLSELARPPQIETGFIQRHLDLVGGVGGAKDILGIVGADSSGRGLVLAAAVPQAFKLSPAFARRFRYVLSHLASATRLREGKETATDEAVLDGSGKLHDAIGAATSRDARVALRRAARAIDRARATRQRSPEAALEAWQALVDARWSLVDRFDSDGRSYLIAKANPPRPPSIAPLTPRERAVVALAALGRSNKLIAYELGLSVGTIASYLVRAQRKLGVTSRATLIRMFHAARPISEAEADSEGGRDA
jgi:DNA-binding NarL/FixJ family response regulator